MAVTDVGPLLDAIDQSTVLPPCEPLRRLFTSLDKHHIIHIVLHWIHVTQHSPSSNILAPQLSRRASRRGRGGGANFQDDDPNTSTVANFLDLHEDRRARSYKQLASLWREDMSDQRVPKSRAIDRVLNVDWPSGLTFAMIAVLSFEVLRAGKSRRIWQTMRFDFGEEQNEGQGTKAASSSNSLLQRLTPGQLRARFSAEMQHYCVHAVFLDVAVQETEETHSAGLLEPLPNDWCQFFTHLRVVTNASQTDVCSTGLHILHIPHSSWCLVSGTLGRVGSEVREMALTALANSVGAKQVKMAHHPEKGGDEPVAVEMGEMTELSGKDPLSLRDVLLNAGLVGEQTEGQDGEDGNTGEGVPGGKGRSMRRGEAEDGPLIRPEKRQREDPSGLYADLEEQQHGWQENHWHVDDIRHPLTQMQAQRRKRRAQQARQREADEVFGKRQDLPRLERVRYELNLPFPTLSDYGQVQEQTIRENPVTLRLEGSHVLAGLRTLVCTGLDSSQEEDSAGLPSWLTEVRGTHVRIDINDEGRPANLAAGS